jgi:hypothetical protein
MDLCEIPQHSWGADVKDKWDELIFVIRVVGVKPSHLSQPWTLIKEIDGAKVLMNGMLDFGVWIVRSNVRSIKGSWAVPVSYSSFRRVRQERRAMAAALPNLRKRVYQSKFLWLI